MSTDRTKNVASLDGKWDFLYVTDVDEAKILVAARLLQRSRDWTAIPVPSNWQLSTKFDRPIYTNVKYPFPAAPPHVPAKNPTGIYRKKFVLKEDWAKTADTDTYTVLFHGVSSAFYVHLNGAFVGYSQDSCLPAEFDITDALRRSERGTHVLEVICIRWSDGSFLEDQDHWWLSGIHRSVEIIRKPGEAEVTDFR